MVLWEGTSTQMICCSSKVKIKMNFYGQALKMLKINSHWVQNPGLIPLKDYTVTLAVWEILGSSEHLRFMPPRIVFEKSGSPFCPMFEEQFQVSWKCQDFPGNGNSHFWVTPSAVSALVPGEQTDKNGTTWALSPAHETPKL